MAAKNAGGCGQVELWRRAGTVEQIATIRGSMVAFSNDVGAITQSLRHYGEWAENEIAFLASFIGKGDTVVDVGAYIGTHTMAFASLVGDAGKVYSLEAQPASFAVLRHNLQLNGIDNVIAMNAVATDEQASGPVPLDMIDPESPRSYGSAVAVGDRAGSAAAPGRARAQVAAVTLGDLPLESCSLIKIDVEGMEDRVLRGAEALLSACQPTIYAECNSVDAGSRVVRQLRKSGYTVWMHVLDAFNPANWRSSRENIFGPNREAALVGVPRHRVGVCASFRSRMAEALFEVDTLDDVVAGMLLKPQYPREVLQYTSAVRRGVQ